MSSIEARWEKIVSLPLERFDKCIVFEDLSIFPQPFWGRHGKLAAKIKDITHLGRSELKCQAEKLRGAIEYIFQNISFFIAAFSHDASRQLKFIHLIFRLERKKYIYSSLHSSLATDVQMKLSKILSCTYKTFPLTSSFEISLFQAFYKKVQQLRAEYEFPEIHLKYEIIQLIDSHYESETVADVINKTDTFSRIDLLLEGKLNAFFYLEDKIISFFNSIIMDIYKLRIDRTVWEKSIGKLYRERRHFFQNVVVHRLNSFLHFRMQRLVENPKIASVCEEMENLRIFEESFRDLFSENFFSSQKTKLFFAFIPYLPFFIGEAEGVQNFLASFGKDFVLEKICSSQSLFSQRPLLIWEGERIEIHKDWLELSRFLAIEIDVFLIQMYSSLSKAERETLEKKWLVNLNVLEHASFFGVILSDLCARKIVVKVVKELEKVPSTTICAFMSSLSRNVFKQSKSINPNVFFALNFFMRSAEVFRNEHLLEAVCICAPSYFSLYFYSADEIFRPKWWSVKDDNFEKIVCAMEKPRVHRNIKINCTHFPKITHRSLTLLFTNFPKIKVFSAFDKSQFSDVCLSYGEKTLYFHSHVLCKFDYFANLLHSGFKETMDKEPVEVEIEDKDLFLFLKSWGSYLYDLSFPEGGRTIKQLFLDVQYALFLQNAELIFTIENYLETQLSVTEKSEIRSIVLNYKNAKEEDIKEIDFLSDFSHLKCYPIIRNAFLKEEKRDGKATLPRKQDFPEKIAPI